MISLDLQWRFGDLHSSREIKQNVLMTVSLPFSGVWCSHSHLRNLLLCNWCKLLNGSNLDQVFYSSPQNHLRLSSDLCQLQTMIWWILMIGSTGVLSFGSLSPSSLSSLSWRVGLEVLWWNKSPLVAWVLYHTLNSIFVEGWSLWVKRSGGSLDVWITLDTFDWGVGEEVQSGLALAQLWHFFLWKNRCSHVLQRPRRDSLLCFCRSMKNDVPALYYKAFSADQWNAKKK